MNDVPAATIKKIQTLAQIAADLRQGKDFNITRLTILKSLCADPDAAAQFALHIAKKTHQSMKRPSSASSKKQHQYQLLAAKAVRQMTAYLKNSTKEAERRYVTRCRRFAASKTDTSISDGGRCGSLRAWSCCALKRRWSACSILMPRLTLAIVSLASTLKDTVLGTGQV